MDYTKYYNKFAKKITKCPVTGKQGQPMPGNPLVWFVEYVNHRGHKKTSMWSYATGRKVEPSAEDTNVL